MKNLYCVICSKYRKFEKPKISYFLEKTLVLSIIYSNSIENQLKKKKNHLKRRINWNIKNSWFN